MQNAEFKMQNLKGQPRVLFAFCILHFALHPPPGMSACDVVGLGENSVDLVYRVPHLPGSGEKVRVGTCRRLLGGQVATTLATCTALGLRTRYVGAFGNDEYRAPDI